MYCVSPSFWRRAFALELVGVWRRWTVTWHYMQTTTSFTFASCTLYIWLCSLAFVLFFGNLLLLTLLMLLCPRSGSTIRPVGQNQPVFVASFDQFFSVGSVSYCSFWFSLNPQFVINPALLYSPWPVNTKNVYFVLCLRTTCSLGAHFWAESQMTHNQKSCQIIQYF